jgi:hypothetical protein
VPGLSLWGLALLAALLMATALRMVRVTAGARSR